MIKRQEEWTFLSSSSTLSGDVRNFLENNEINKEIIKQMKFE